MTGKSRDLTKGNRQTVLGCLLDGQALSRIDIAKMTGFSPATVNRLTAALMASGLVEEVGSDISTGGRPSLLVKFNPQARQILAADVTQHGIELAETSLLGDVLSKRFISIKGLDGPGIMQQFVRAIAEQCQAHKESPYVAVGVSVPGPVTSDGIVTIAPAVDWYDADLGTALRREVPILCTVENDVNLIAYAEYHRQFAGTIDALVAIGVYQGVGAGIVEGGRLWRGNGGAAGQFGRMLMDVEGLRSNRKGFGQVERRLGADALRERAVEAAVVISDDDSADVVFQQVQEGDAKATQLFAEAMDEYAFQLANLSAIVAPEVIVFAGLFEKWSHLVIPELETRLEGNVLHRPTLLAATLKDDAKLVGAALYACDRQGGILSLA